MAPFAVLPPLPPVPNGRKAVDFLEVPTPANPSDDVLLDVLEHKAFAFFWNETHLQTGLTKDRARNLGEGPDTLTLSSIACVGYALAALPIGVTRGWVSDKDAYYRALITLRYVYDKLPNNHGFFFHFIHWGTGDRVGTNELSSIDTGLLVIGALVAGQYWKGTEVDRLANAIYNRLDWQWMQRGDGSKPEVKTLSHGWKPETGWLASRWDTYSEASFLYILAMGSPTMPVGPEAWNQWRVDKAQAEGYPVFGGPRPAFMAQMTPGYLDWRNVRDRQGRDWWTNFRNAHRSNQAYCARNPWKSKTYSASIWGITACRQPRGYKAQQPQDGRNDGTVAPTGAISGIFITPDLSRASLRALWDQYREQLWGRYGFSNAFNVDQDWYDTDVLGLDLGMMILCIENYRSGLIWRLMMSHPAMQKGMAGAGMRS